ncbi:fungal-specific transcription factor domain-containing protein [Trichoderma velutinum]
MSPNTSGGKNGERKRSAASDDAAPQQTFFKRQRTALACNSCRSRKTRCDGSRPRCTMCVEMGLECFYQQPAGASGKQHSTELEGRLHSIEETLRLLVGRQEAAAPPSINSRSVLDPEDAEESSRDDSQAQIQFEDTVDGMGAITFADEQESGFFGPSSNIAFIGQITHAMATAANTDPTRPLPVDARMEGAMMSISRPASPIAGAQSLDYSLSAAVDVYSLPPEADMLHLIRLFFADTGMLFPYVHEGSLLEEFAAAKQNNFTSIRRSWLCLLNMILAFATCVSARPDLPVERNAAESDVFFKRAQALSGKMAFRTANVEIVQYLLLMTQFLQGTQRSAQTWNLHGLTVKAALQLGLHTSSSYTKFTPLEREIRKRTWYGCVVLDRTLSMTFGRPPAIPVEYVQMALPLDVEFDVINSVTGSSLEMLGGPSTVSFYIFTIKLYSILGDVIADQYGQNLGCAPQPSISLMLESVIRLESKLLQWKRDLPLQLKARPWDDSLSETNQNIIFDRLSIILSLRYLNTRILLHRQVLARFLEQINNGNSNSEEGLFLRQFGHGSFQVCLESASEIISIVHKMGKKPSLLGAWWFSTYYTFNAALAVFSGLLIQANGIAGPMTAGLEIEDLRTSLYLAVEALQNLGGGARLVQRCRKYLETLVRVAATTKGGGNAQANWINILQPGELDSSQMPGFPSAPSRSDTELSPLGLDLGEFLTEDNLDFLTGLMDSSQQVVMEVPIQSY